MDNRTMGTGDKRGKSETPYIFEERGLFLDFSVRVIIRV